MSWKQAFALGLCSVGAYEVKDEQWETVWSGAITTKKLENNGAMGVFTEALTAPLFIGGETIRLTIEGASAVFTAVDNILGAVAGNEWLAYFNDSKPDTGYDFLVWARILSSVKHGVFYSRTPGTYTVKIERKL